MPATTPGPTPPPAQPDAGTEYQRIYPGHADQLRRVRHDVASHLDHCPAREDAVLAASEFAANAILHSRSRGQQFTIRIQRHTGHVRVECHDAGGPWRPRRPDDHPHGLGIVQALTGPEGWGVHVTGDSGRIVWAQLTC